MPDNLKPFQNDEKSFYFILKLFSFLKYLHFSADSGYVGKRLGKKATVWLVSKFMTSQTGHQVITIYILANISRSKGSQAMKFGQLIKHNVRNILLQRTCRK